MPKAVEIVRPPTLTTLRKYGLTVEDWKRFCFLQQCICPVCLQPFGGRKLVIDHEHVAGFKARKRRKGKRKVGGKRQDVRVRVMLPSERRKHVRGILHAWCNGWVRSWLTLERTRSILLYLEAHKARKDGQVQG